ncbi:MAG: acyl-CoA dehydrogenase family protein [Gammaproteobacteria bacterium]|nr:acyl-CoA dehydrogenase family protein [Gammaproteobacteria bacterium]MCG3146169.1 Acyl-CoA dehydrogenase [Gammaproteobacteria bacterium]
MAGFDAADFYDLNDLCSAGERRVRDGVRAWVGERFLPIIQRHYRNGTFPLELTPELARLGVFGPGIRGYGCAGLGAVACGLMMQELERGDSGLRTYASVQGSLAMMAINLFGSEEQKLRWLPAMAKGEKIGCFGLTEPEFGSNPGGMQTRARKSADGYVLDGRKMWIGNGTVADVAIVWAKVEGEDGVDPDSPKAVRGFLVEKDALGFRRSLIEGKLSLRAALTARLEFENCELPASALLPRTDGLKSAFQCLNQARYGIAWGALGAAMACFEEARQYAIRRIAFGRPIGGFQLVQAKLAHMATAITRAQLLAWRLAQLKDAGSLRPPQISMAKMNNVQMALEVARSARDILGGVGILDEHQCFRHMCNLESVSTYEGTRDIHLLVLGEAITGLPAYS